MKERCAGIAERWGLMGLDLGLKPPRAECQRWSRRRRRPPADYAAAIVSFCGLSRTLVADRAVLGNAQNANLISAPVTVVTPVHVSMHGGTIG